MAPRFPEVLSLVTGLHTGAVPFTVRWTKSEPALDPEWEDVVEVPFTVTRPDLLLSAFDQGVRFRLPASGRLRARFCATGMDAAHAIDTRGDDTDELDRYLLALWPSPPRPEHIVRQTSGIAAYWHTEARKLPPPPTPAEIVRAQEVADQAAASQQALDREIRERMMWGGRSPSDRLRTLRGNVLGVARSDRDLLDDLAALDPATQRAVARWLARRAFVHAGLDQLDWVRPALEALDRGERLPPPFTSAEQIHALVSPPGPTSANIVEDDARLPPGPWLIHRPSFAVPALFSAIDADPLQAAVDAFSHAAATFQSERESLIADLRARFIRSS